jgi:pimeloyl-ACP methyl ester carboxylesterase
MMSIWLAETDPAIGGIVDVDGMPFLASAINPAATEESATQLAAGMRQQLLSSPHDTFVSFMHQFLASTVSDPQNLAMLDAAASKCDQTTVANAFAELLGKDLRGDLGKITVPVLIVAAGVDTHGESKDTIEAEWHAQIDAIPHHDLHVVDGAKHFVMLDKPDEFYALVDKALQ